MKGLADVLFHLWIIPPSTSNASTNLPKCRYVNLQLYPGSQFKTSFKACILLENPQRQNILTYNELESQVKSARLSCV